MSTRLHPHPHFLLCSPWLMILLGGGLAFFIYAALPALGMNTLETVFSWGHLLTISGLLLGGILYTAYYRWVAQKPEFLVFFILILWPFVEYFSENLLLQGINIHLRPILLLILGLPGFGYLIQNRKMLWAAFPYLKYALAFWLVVMGYFVFFNSNTLDLRFGQDSVLTEGSMETIQLTAYTFCFISLIVSGTAILKHDKQRQFFDQLNTGLLVSSSIIALVTLLGYPFNLFSTNLDGFHRAMGVFTHPNPFSHHMGVLLLYLTGLSFYYQGQNKRRIPKWLLVGGLLLNTLAFLLGLSKTAIGVFALSTVLLVLFNLSSAHIWRNLLKGLLILAVIVTIGLSAYQLLTDTSFFDILQSRLEQRQSLNWRMEVWQELLANMDSASIFFGHGFTAANQLVFQYSFNDKLNPHPLMMVHNGYIALLYDFGLLGAFFFIAVLSMLFNTLRQFFQNRQPPNRSLLATIIALCTYFFLTCGFDEMTYMFDAPLLFWVFCTIMTGLVKREEVL
jgi:O-Antigen ligase